MQDYISIGCTPVDEECAQVGTPGYYERARKECRTFAKQLLREFGPPPEGARLKIEGFPHDAGTYHEVAVVYDTTKREAVEYALKLEGNTPAKWDEESKKDLGIIHLDSLDRVQDLVNKAYNCQVHAELVVILDAIRTELDQVEVDHRKYNK